MRQKIDIDTIITNEIMRIVGLKLKVSELELIFCLVENSQS